MENKNVALVAVAAMVMVLISTFTPLALAADEAGHSDGGNEDLIAVVSISRSNGGKGDSVAADSVNWVSSNRKTLRSRLFLPQGYLQDSGEECSQNGEPCGSFCCGSCICVVDDVHLPGICRGNC